MLATLRIALPGLGASLPDAALAGIFLAAWIAPERMGEGILGWCLLVMLLEFIIVHSSAFLGSLILGGGPRDARIRAGLGLGALYTLFVAGFALAFRTWWPLLSFWALTGKRLLNLFAGVVPSGEEKMLMQRTWAASVLFYLLGVFATLFLPVPRLGITREVVRAADLPSSGEWVSHPEKVVAFGFLYFALMTISGIRGHRWAQGGIPKDPDTAARHATPAGRDDRRSAA